MPESIVEYLAVDPATGEETYFGALPEADEVPEEPIHVRIEGGALEPTQARATASAESALLSAPPRDAAEAQRNLPIRTARQIARGMPSGVTWIAKPWVASAS